VPRKSQAHDTKFFTFFMSLTFLFFPVSTRSGHSLRGSRRFRPLWLQLPSTTKRYMSGYFFQSLLFARRSFQLSRHFETEVRSLLTKWEDNCIIQTQNVQCTIKFVALHAKEGFEQ